MDIRQITPRFYAAPQLSPEDMPEIAAAGIKRVVCNRPDQEIPPSHHASVLEQAAKSEGLEFMVLPLTHENMTPQVIAENKALIEGSDGPVVAYCASGTRSTIAWALGAASNMDIDDVIAAARAGGYDLSNMRQTLQAASQL